MRKRLLGEKDLTYTRAVELAMSIEAAGRDAAEMNLTSRNSAVNYVKDKKTGSTPKRDVEKAVTCYCCGKANHKSSVCKFRNLSCNICGKVGHLANVCKGGKKSEFQRGTTNTNGGNQTKHKKREKQNFLEEFDDSNEEQNFVEELDDLREEQNLVEVDDFNDTSNKIFYNQAEEIDTINNIKPFVVDLKVENVLTRFEIDTGSPISAISIFDYKRSKRLSELKLKDTQRKFRSYQGARMVPEGVLDVDVSYKNKSLNLELFILPGDSTPIVGRDWLGAFEMVKFDSQDEVLTIKSVTGDVTSNIDHIIKQYSSVFSDKLGKYTKGKFSLHLKEGASPVHYKPRPVPYAMRTGIEDELYRLVDEGIIEPIESSDWASPIVPVLKTNRQIRLCGDYKVTFNPHLQVDKYPIPRVPDLLTKLHKGCIYTKLDLAQAYQQVELDEESKKLVTIATHKGLFKFNRLSYGVSSAPGLFQREMEKVLNDLEGVVVYFDDVVVSGKDKLDHDRNLCEVLRRFQECGLTVNKEKCEFAKTEIHFLGFRLDSQGLRASEKKIKAILAMSTPENQAELRSFLGMINYYSRFI